MNSPRYLHYSPGYIVVATDFIVQLCVAIDGVNKFNGDWRFYGARRELCVYFSIRPTKRK